MIDVVYVVLWRYGDGSASGAVAAFSTSAAAEKLVALLKDQESRRSFKIEAIPFEAHSK